MNIAAAPTDARRPGRPKSEEKAGAICDAAGHLFMTQGVDKTSMDAIAQTAGVSKQTVYSHFNSKDDLFRACIVSKVHMYGLDESQLDLSVPVDEALERIGFQFLTLLSDPEVVQMFRLMIAEAKAFPRLAKMFHETGPRATTRYVARIFAHYLAEDDREHAKRAAKEFLAIVKGDYLIERLLETRQVLTEAERVEHVQRCVVRIRSLYAFNPTAAAS